MKNGTNSLRIRDYNQQVVLELVRTRGGMSRVEIAEKTGLTEQAISKIVKRLMDEGLILEAGKGPPLPRGGRPPVGLKVDPDAGYAVGVEIDRDGVSCLLLNLDGRVLARGQSSTLPEEMGPSEVVGRIVDLVDRVIEEAGVGREPVLGLGVACPGPLDPASGVVHQPPGMPGWGEVPLKEILEERTGYAVIVDNDAVAAAVGERWMGRARGARNFVFVYKGWGMGAGIFVEGHVYRGSLGTAGEIGHMPLDPHGPECPCGNRGCLIRYCSPAEIASAVKERLLRGGSSSLGDGSRDVDFGMVCRAALAGDELALDEIGRSGKMLGKALVMLVNVLDPELVVLGGRAFSEAGEIYRREIEGTLEKKILYRDRRKVRVELSDSGEDAGAVGAASLILYAAYAPRFAGLRAF